MRICGKIKVLLLTGYGMPDIFVFGCDDPVVRKVSVGMFAVEPGPLGFLRICGKGQETFSVNRGGDRSVGKIQYRRHNITKLCNAVADGAAPEFRQNIFPRRDDQGDMAAALIRP